MAKNALKINGRIIGYQAIELSCNWFFYEQSRSEEL